MSKNIDVKVTINVDKIKIPIKVMIGCLSYDGFLSKEKLYLEESKNKNGF